MAKYVVRFLHFYGHLFINVADAAADDDKNDDDDDDDDDDNEKDGDD